MVVGIDDNLMTIPKKLHTFKVSTFFLVETTRSLQIQHQTLSEIIDFIYYPQDPEPL